MQLRDERAGNALRGEESETQGHHAEGIPDREGDGGGRLGGDKSLEIAPTVIEMSLNCQKEKGPFSDEPPPVHFK
ncbi:MAG: hypothetical protein H5U13_01990 [Parvibaculum sp.]|nr:hypothetical protein [Parvibaculum sp.]